MVAYIELTRDDDKRVGEGPEPSPGPRFGCTAPFAKNWDPQAERYGQEGQAASINQAINGQVCTYAQRVGEVSSAMDIPGLDRFRAWHMTDWVRGGGDYSDQAYSDTFMGNACYDDSSDEVVIRHWDANRDNPKAKSPLMACHDGEIMPGVVEQNHLVLDQREGVFEETEYSTGNWAGLGVSVMVPPDGMRFDRTYYFENMYDETNPPDYPGAGQLTEYTLYWPTGENPIGPLAYALVQTRNKTTMKKRGEAAANLQENKEYKDNMYGPLWRVGDPRIGTLADLDLDKNGRIGWVPGATTGSPHENVLLWTRLVSFDDFNPSGLANQNGIYGYDGTPEGVTLGWSTPELLDTLDDGDDVIDQYVHMMQMDLDKDDRVSFWELAHVVKAHASRRVWFPDEGILGYDGVACADREELDLANVACFPFSEVSMDSLEVERQRIADTNPWYQLNTDESELDTAFLTDVEACMRAGGEWPENYDEIQEMMLMQGMGPGAHQFQPMRMMGLAFCMKLKSEEYGFDPEAVFAKIHGHQPYERKRFDEEDLTPGNPSVQSPYYETGYPENPCFSQTKGNMAECQRVYVEIPRESDLPTTGLIEAMWPQTINALGDESNFGGLEFFMGGHPFFDTFPTETGYQIPYDWNEDSGDLAIARNSCPSSHPYFVRLCSVSETSDHLVGETIDIDYNEQIENENI